MALASIIKEGATTVAATGGTDVTLVSLGIRDNKNPLIFSTDSALNLALRRTIEFSVKPTAVSPGSPGGQSNAKNTISYRQPKVLANGDKGYLSIKVETSYHPEFTQAEVEAGCETVAQTLGTAAFLDFQKNQNLS